MDPYSFTSVVRWVNHEWLAEAAMWLAWAAGGAPELIALKLALAATALMLSTWKPRRQRTLPDRDLRGCFRAPESRERVLPRFS